ncbi:MAG: cytochrome c1 [Rhodospirillales bacterium]|nr:cytochrome c1 [Rhodospirillales bacterium]
MRPLVAFLVSGLIAVTSPLFSKPLLADDASEEVSIPGQDWSFSGPFGRYDQAALRRGLRVYIDGCWSCHSLRHVAFRNLSTLGVGFGPEDIKALASEFDVQDGPNEDGEMFVRPGRPSDRFPPPFANKQMARQMNNGMVPPDLSLITKARPGGPDYVYAVLVGYQDPPDSQMPIPGMNYNPYVPARYTGMKAPLIDDLVEYDDGTEATVEQMAKDVTEFLAWAADPHMEARKKLGVRVVIFLALLTIMFIALKRETWAHLHERRERALRATNAGE